MHKITSMPTLLPQLEAVQPSNLRTFDAGYRAVHMLMCMPTS